ncbi:hypothetical protein VPH35_105022 [Triticum aestivum]
MGPADRVPFGSAGAEIVQRVDRGDARERFTQEWSWLTVRKSSLGLKKKYLRCRMWLKEQSWLVKENLLSRQRFRIRSLNLNQRKKKMIFPWLTVSPRMNRSSTQRLFSPMEIPRRVVAVEKETPQLRYLIPRLIKLHLELKQQPKEISCCKGFTVTG